MLNAYGLAGRVMRVGAASIVVAALVLVLVWYGLYEPPRTPFRFAALVQGAEGIQAMVPGPEPGHIVAAGDSGSLYLWDLERNRLLRRERRFPTQIVGLSTRDGALAVACLNGELAVLDARTWKPLRTIHSDEPLGSAVLGPNHTLLVGGARGFVRCWNWKSGDLLWQSRVGTHMANAAVIHPNGRMYAASSGRAVTIWDAQGHPLHQFNTEFGVCYLAFTDDDTSLYMGGLERHLMVYDMEYNSVVPIGPALAGTVSFLGVDAAGQRLLLGGYCWTAEVDPATGDPVVTGKIPGNAEAILADGPRRIVATPIHSFRIGDEVRGLTTYENWCLAWSPAGDTIAVGNRAGCIQKYSASEPEAIAPVNALLHGRGIGGLLWLADGRLISAGWDGTIAALQGDRPLWRVTHGSGPVLALSASPDGKRLVSSDQRGRIRLWRLEDQGEPTLQAEVNWVSSVRGLAFSPDGQQIAAAAHNGRVLLLDPDGHEPPILLEGHSGPVVSVGWTPDGRYVVSGSQDRTCRVWDAAARKAVRIHQDHEEMVTSVHVSPDGTWLATGSLDNSVRLYRMGESAPRETLAGFRHSVLDVRFSPDGSRLAATGRDGAVRVYPVQP